MLLIPIAHFQIDVLLFAILFRLNAATFLKPELALPPIAS
ncbi:hypothetical protein SPHINGO8BC_10058 [Sphingobacterium multivorum]|uniref:Uncharacterized protein n=1 Tax=Sphingobacterium multivorum TaxID=28454 RepID=A0A653XM09_SPHMU|nr:hypothetical protein SPHINGO8BC_10058 [Sphingobacterium multivorum]